MHCGLKCGKRCKEGTLLGCYKYGQIESRRRMYLNVVNVNHALKHELYVNVQNIIQYLIPLKGYSFIHLVVCHTTDPKPPPKRALYILRSRASSFKWEYPFLSLRSSNSFLRLLPRLPFTSIPFYLSFNNPL